MKKTLLSIAALALGITAYAGTVTFDFTTGSYGLPPYDVDLGNNVEYAANGAVIVDGVVKIQLDYTPQTNEAGEELTDGGWRMWNDGLRAYSKRKPTFTVSTSNGEDVTKVSWDVVSGATFALDGTDNNITNWTGAEASVTFDYTADSNKAVKSITVVYGEAAEPDPEPETPGVPEGTITVAKALELIEGGYTGEATVQGYIVNITEVSVDYGNATYIIADNASETSGLTIFRGYYLNGEKFTEESQIKIGDNVVVKGNLTLYNTTPEMNSGSVILSLNGETPEPENPGQTEGSIFSEPFSTSLGDFTIENFTLPEELNYVWSFANNYGAKASGYYNGNYATESALISPVIDLTNYMDVTLSFDHAVNYANGNTVSDYCVVLVKESSEEDWNNISGQVTYPEGNNWTFVNSGEISLKACEGKKIQLGFLYTSTEQVAPTWEIKNLEVNGKANSGAVQGIETDVNAPVEYFNLQGQKVLNPSNGIFIIRQGNKTSKAVIR